MRPCRHRRRHVRLHSPLRLLATSTTGLTKPSCLLLLLLVIGADSAFICPGRGGAHRQHPHAVGHHRSRILVQEYRSATVPQFARRRRGRRGDDDHDDGTEELETRFRSNDGSKASRRRGRSPMNDAATTKNDGTSSRGSSSTTSSSSSSPWGYRPTPAMPSQLFQQLAQSQLELLAASLRANGSSSSSSTSKVKSMALYLPQENARTGQLEFLPVVLHPHPDTDRVFIAPDATSGLAPALPRTLTKLPGFAVASSLLPGYPMVTTSATDAGVGVVEEVFCDVRGGQGRGGSGAALSVPLFSGSQTVGVLLVSPSDDLDSSTSSKNSEGGGSVWTDDDREQVARAAKSLSLALSMDTERIALQRQNQAVKEALSDSLHQLKNPLQALRTYGKLLQQRIADSESTMPSPQASSSSAPSANDSSRGSRTATPKLLELADHLLIQSDRISQRLKPVDWIVDRMDDPPPRPPLLLLRPAEERSLVRWTPTGSAGRDSSSTRDSSSALVPSGRLVPEESRQKIRQVQDTEETVSTTDDDERRDVPDRQRSYLFDSQDDSMEIGFLEDVLEPVVSAFRAIATDRSIIFDVDISDDVPGVMVSAPAIQEVTSNLLDNAFKYVGLVNDSDFSRVGQPRTPPRVRLWIASNPPGLPPGATINVEDNGPGIPEAELDAIFTRGYRGSQSSSAIQGSGLGLDIARSLVQHMGGSIRAVPPRQASKIGCRLTGAVIEVVLYRNPTKAGSPL